ncbi:MAG: hypothetical protein AVDCRST_MAG56-7081, partial [uncultured Cytophagales bacterium]
KEFFHKVRCDSKTRLKGMRTGFFMHNRKDLGFEIE